MDVDAGTLPERLAQVREHFRRSMGDMAASVGVERKSWERYEKGGSRPNSDVLMALVEQGISPEWLLTGQGAMLADLGGRPGGTVPVLGMAECGLRGWYQESPTGLYASAPPSVAAAGQGVAVVATGNSMRPAGINPGDMVFCADGPPPQAREAVLVELTDGLLSLKQWGGQRGDWVTLRGWLDADTGAVQMPYGDERRQDQISRIRRVVLVQPGLPVLAGDGVPPPGGDRLYDVAIRTTLRWYRDAKLDLAPDNMAGLISRAVRLLRDRQGDVLRTDDDLAADVRQVLDAAKDMLAAIGWQPK